VKIRRGQAAVSGDPSLNPSMRRTLGNPGIQDPGYTEGRNLQEPLSWVHRRMGRRKE